jgi:hypothetical protein
MPPLAEGEDQGSSHHHLVLGQQDACARHARDRSDLRQGPATQRPQRLC